MGVCKVKHPETPSSSQVKCAGAVRVDGCIEKFFMEKNGYQLVVDALTNLLVLVIGKEMPCEIS
jgi:hypothetical protein